MRAVGTWTCCTSSTTTASTGGRRAKPRRPSSSASRRTPSPTRTATRPPTRYGCPSPQALEKALEWGDRIPIGVFYKNEHVLTFEERIAQRVPTYMEHPPALQPIAGPNGEPRTDLTPLMQRLMFKAE